MVKSNQKKEIKKKHPDKTAPRLLFRIMKWMFFTFILLGVLTAIGLYGLYRYLLEDLPQINSLADYRPFTVTSVYADGGEKIAEFYKERRIVIPFSKMPQRLQHNFPLQIQGE